MFIHLKKACIYIFFLNLFPNFTYKASVDKFTALLNYKPVNITEMPLALKAPCMFSRVKHPNRAAEAFVHAFFFFVFFSPLANILVVSVATTTPNHTSANAKRQNSGRLTNNVL